MNPNLINNTIKSFEKFILYNIFNIQECNNFYSSLNNIKTEEELINHYKNFGNNNISDILKLYLGTNYNDFIDSLKKINKYDKYKLINNNCIPYGFKTLEWTKSNHFKNSKYINKNKIIEDYTIVESSESCQCYDLKRSSDNFLVRVYGLKIVFQSHITKNTIIFNCICEDIIINKNNKYNNCLKDLLIYNNEELEANYLFESKSIESYFNTNMEDIIKEFMTSGLFYKRKLLILLLKSSNNKIKNIAFMLYDLLNNNRKNYEFNSEKKLIYISIPNNLKQLLNSEFNNNIIIDDNLEKEIEIPIETKIKILNVDGDIKKNIYSKLKEFKSKTDDNHKVRQYLEGIVSVPFGVYNKEEMLQYSDRIKLKTNKSIIEFIYEYKYENNIHLKIYNSFLSTELLTTLNKIKKNTFVDFNIKFRYINKKQIISQIHSNILNNKFDKEYLYNLFTHLNIKNCSMNDYFNYQELGLNISKLKNSIKNIKTILDKSVHAHNNSKREIQRLFSQWISGEQDGYCLGFEGPPGIGKTTIAKYGISECLKDSNGKIRPFNFLSLGGLNNSSLLDGHNYTYVGSTWGKFVDFLIKSKCMNPIIYIDELDKVSKTEYGNEIIGILTHLTDSTQNSHFSDKYFSGIPFDFSKVLFIFSYNDPSAIDPILLDRIHRIKFNHLSLKEKIVITNKFLIPEMFKKLNMNDNILKITNENIEFIIENYTMESGVRKLKQLLFSILSEINIELINEKYENIPVTLLNNDIKHKYLKEKNPIIKYKINTNETKIYGMWANSLGLGGVLPIDIRLFPTNNQFELKLTGLPGTVMKESMHVSQTIAWNYLSEEEKNDWTNRKIGIHIHCPDGSTNKDGPSAGSAITTSLISFMKYKKVKNNIAMTGEICLNGDITAIGGLELKINGGIKAGITEFVFPTENIPDFDKIENKEHFENIKFHNVKHISELLNIALL